MLLDTRRTYDPETTLDRVVREAADEDPGGSGLAATSGFVVDLGRALLSFGLPAQRLEEALERVGSALGCSVDCFSTPTALVLTIGQGEEVQTRVVRLAAGESDLERLSALHDLVARVERRELSPADGSRRIRRILERKGRYGEVTLVLAHGAASATASILLGGGPGDALPALGLGLLVGFLVRAARSAPSFARVLPVLVAATTTLLARVFAVAGLPVHEPVLVLASVITLLPGFTLTVATLELATANLVSGTSRLVGALATLVQIGFGVALGHRLALLLPALPATVPAESPEWLVYAAHGAAALAFTILLRAAPRDILAILLAAAIAVIGARLGRVWLGPELGALVGATSIALVAHGHARLKDRPVLLLLTPGILMMVPGSVGFLSVSSMLDADVVTALETAFRMILIATSLAAGVLLATLAIPPRRAL